MLEYSNLHLKPAGAAPSHCLKVGGYFGWSRLSGQYLTCSPRRKGEACPRTLQSLHYYWGFL